MSQNQPPELLNPFDVAKRYDYFRTAVRSWYPDWRDARALLEAVLLPVIRQYAGTDRKPDAAEQASRWLEAGQGMREAGIADYPAEVLANRGVPNGAGFEPKDFMVYAVWSLLKVAAEQDADGMEPWVARANTWFASHPTEFAAEVRDGCDGMVTRWIQVTAPAFVERVRTEAARLQLTSPQIRTLPRLAEDDREQDAFLIWLGGWEYGVVMVPFTEGVFDVERTDPISPLQAASAGTPPAAHGSGTLTMSDQKKTAADRLRERHEEEERRRELARVEAERQARMQTWMDDFEARWRAAVEALTAKLPVDGSAYTRLTVAGMDAELLVIGRLLAEKDCRVLEDVYRGNAERSILPYFDGVRGTFNRDASLRHKLEAFDHLRICFEDMAVADAALLLLHVFEGNTSDPLIELPDPRAFGWIRTLIDLCGLRRVEPAYSLRMFDPTNPRYPVWRAELPDRPLVWESWTSHRDRWRCEAILRGDVSFSNPPEELFRGCLQEVRTRTVSDTTSEADAVAEDNFDGDESEEMPGDTTNTDTSSASGDGDLTDVDDGSPGDGCPPQGWEEMGEAKRAILTALHGLTKRLDGQELAKKAGYTYGTLRRHTGNLQRWNYIDLKKDGYALTPVGEALMSL